MELSQQRILVAEDNCAMASVIGFNLRRAGYDVTLCANGDEAWAALQDQEFDFLVTDYQMPGRSGLELIQAIRADASLADLPVILLTAKGLEIDGETLTRELRLTGLHVKPFSPRELVEHIRSCLEAVPSA